MKQLLFLFLIVFAGCTSSETPPAQATAVNQPSETNAPYRALIIDGQNNHEVWPKSTVMMKQYLEETGLFTVDVERTQYTWKGESHLANFTIKGLKPTEVKEQPTADPAFSPDFADYDVIVSNFGWNAAALPKETEQKLEAFVSEGGGLVIIHAADNSWPQWLEFNKMIGLGGWGDRTEKDGPYVYYNDAGELVRDESPGSAGHHGPQHEFLVQVRDSTHPITKGMPAKWLHTKDELYDQLRGPAENMTVLATTYASPEQDGTGRHEPMIMTIDYGKGRVFHTPMGHEDYSFEGVGFITTFIRGTEWATTGKVTQGIPEDFPSATNATSRAFSAK